MKVCITEKPSVAAEIASVLGAKKKHDGYYEGNGYRVTWTFGHLCCLKAPDDYTPNWKRWSLATLPMVPAQFAIKLIPDAGYKKQFGIIKSLVAKADEVVNCGDAGQEGELIQRWVMQMAGVKCPVKRLWISSLTEEAIRQGFKNLRPSSEFDNLYVAGMARAVGDWLLGMNCTRLFSLKYSVPGKVLSVGRVQTPTLAMIVDRQARIDGFKVENYWELHTTYKGLDFLAKTDERLDAKANADDMLDQVKEKPFTVVDVKEKEGREQPPRLFDLTSLQVECNKRWGWTADETLKLIQSLYEKKTTTYPRVDTTFLTDDIYGKVPDILRRMTPYAHYIRALDLERLPFSRRVFDNGKVTDHHAIIPTGENPSRLVGNEKLMYHLIAQRFISVFYPDCTFSTTTVLGKVAEVIFRASGKVVTDAGWRKVWGGEGHVSETDPSQKTIPSMMVGESGQHTPSLLKKSTQPPAPYTEGTLLKDMEGAGKTLTDDEELRQAMKDNGIGRPSTRANIIETLFKRRYLVRKGKAMLPTAAGKALVSMIHEDLLKSAKLTGQWECKLRKIERGEYSPQEFLAELKSMLAEVTANVLSDNSGSKIQIADSSPAPTRKRKTAKKETKAVSSRASADEVRCPVCGKGVVIRGNTAYGCSRWAEGCAFKVPFSEMPQNLTNVQLAKKLTHYF